MSQAGNNTKKRFPEGGKKGPNVSLAGMIHRLGKEFEKLCSDMGVYQFGKLLMNEFLASSRRYSREAPEVWRAMVRAG